MEYLTQTKETNNIKMQSATLFQSESWNFKPQTLEFIEDIKNNQRNLNKTDEENPFKRAKQACLEKDKSVSNVSISGKSIEEEEFGDDTAEELTTFRLIKRGSLNTTLQSVSFRQF